MPKKRRRLTRKMKEELAALAAMPDDAIDCSDIPEQTDWSGAVRGRFSNQKLDSGE